MTKTQTHEGVAISEIVDGHLVTRHYIGYTRREAESLFRTEVKSWAKKR